MTTIITTVGTSILSKYFDDNNSNINSAQRRAFEVLPFAENQLNTHHYTMFKNAIEGWQKYRNGDTSICAELSSLELLRKRYPDSEVVLVTTDTLASYLAATLVKAKLTKNEIIERIGGLKVNDATKFKNDGIQHLMQRILTIHDKDPQGNCALNISGGYKALIPILTIMGQLYKMPIYYTYEDSDELIEIQPMPLSFDWEVARLYAPHMTKEGLAALENNSAILTDLQKQGFIKQGTKEPTVSGEIFKKYAIGLSDTQKGDLGYVIEMRITEQLIESGKNAKRSVEYWWDKIDTSKYYLQPQYNRNAQRETPIEIDVVLYNGDTQQEWWEVKALSPTGVNKAFIQLEKKVDFINSTSIMSPKTFILAVYKLHGTVLSANELRIAEFEKLCRSIGANFKFISFDLPTNKKGLPDIKKISNKGFELVTIYPSTTPNP